MAIRSDGKLVPAPQFAAFSDPDLLISGRCAPIPAAGVYAAGGSDAKVLRFDDPAKPTTVFEAPELSAQTIAFDANDNLYVGTSPDGKVYKVTPDGQKTVFFDPKAKYIWALAIDPQGTLFVGTGDKDEIFAVTPDGKGQLFYQSDERHARSLAFDAKGNLLVGTDPDGLILRIEITRAAGSKDLQTPPKAGASFVVYETDKKEVTSLLTDSTGNLYAAAIGEKQRPPTPSAPPAIIAPLTERSSAARHQGAVTISDPGRGRRATSSRVLALPFHHRRLAGGENFSRRLARDALDFAGRTRFSHGLFARAENFCWAPATRAPSSSLKATEFIRIVAKTASAQVTSLIAGTRWQDLRRHRKSRKTFHSGPWPGNRGQLSNPILSTPRFSRTGDA